MTNALHSVAGIASKALLALQDWEPGGHPEDWPSWVGPLALALLLGAYGWLLVRSFLRRHWYRASDVLQEADLAAVHRALAEAEARTVGEVLPVVLERSDRHPGALWLAAMTSLLCGTAALAPWLPWGHPGWLLGAQLALGGIGYATAWWLPDFQRFFISESRANEVAEEQAFQEFYRHGLFRTEARTGVLLFVSLLERRAIVLADEGIHSRVDPQSWVSTDQALLEGIRGGSLRDGLVAGIQAAGERLAREFPVAEGDANEIPDRVIVRRE